MTSECHIDSLNYAGPDRREGAERRDCDDKIHRIVHEKVGACKDQVYMEIHALRGDISNINDRLNTLSDDVHKLGLAVRDIANNSGDIANSLREMQSVVTTYNKVRGAWDVFDWLRKNVLTIAVVLVVLYYVVAHGNVADLLGMLLP